MQNNKNTSQTKTTRALYLISLLILCAMAAVVAITMTANHRAKPQPQVTQTTGGAKTTTAPQTNITTAPPATQPEPQTTPPAAPETTGEPNADAMLPAAMETDAEPDVAVDNTPQSVPVFAAPAAGSLAKLHDSEAAVFSTTMNDYRVHLGIDITTNEGAPVYAAANGTVSQVYDDPMSGKTIVISHTGGFDSIYRNLAGELPLGIEAGAPLRAGQLIAAVGQSSIVEIAEEPHLHFELTRDGVHVDPLEYISRDTFVASASAGE